LLSHLPTQDLAEHRAWRLLDLYDQAQGLVRRELLAAVGPQRSLVELGARLTDAMRVAAAVCRVAGGIPPAGPTGGGVDDETL